MQNLTKICKNFDKASPKPKRGVLLLVYVLLTLPLLAQNPDEYSTKANFSSTTNSEDLREINTIEYAINWQTLMLTSKIHSAIENTAHATESLYSQQNKTYKTIETKLPSILSVILDTLTLSSQYSLPQFMKKHNIYATVLNNIYTNSSRTHHIPDKNFLGITVGYTTYLAPFLLHAILPQFSTVPVPTEASVLGIFYDTHYRSKAIYTHLVFSVEEPLPILGENTLGKDAERRLFTPTFMPRVVTQDGRIVYSPEYFESLPKKNNTNATANSTTNLPFQYMYEKNAKEAPFRTSAFIIIPIAMNNQAYPDILISNNDARTILGSKVIRDLIRSGKVIFVISNESEHTTRIALEKTE